jgi:hypothetical protein
MKFATELKQMRGAHFKIPVHFEYAWNVHLNGKSAQMGGQLAFLRNVLKKDMRVLRLEPLKAVSHSQASLD